MTVVRSLLRMPGQLQATLTQTSRGHDFQWTVRHALPLFVLDQLKITDRQRECIGRTARGPHACLSLKWRLASSKGSMQGWAGRS